MISAEQTQLDATGDKNKAKPNEMTRNWYDCGKAEYRDREWRRGFVLGNV